MHVLDMAGINNCVFLRHVAIKGDYFLYTTLSDDVFV